MAAERPAVDPSRPIPVYEQLKAHLIQLILSGRYGADGQLPTESELCATYGLSRTPVHRALAALAAEGVVVRHRRRGTFVAPEWLEKHAGVRELTAVVPEGPWAKLIRAETPTDVALSLTVVPLGDLHDHLTEAVASGEAPDIALVDSVWVPEFATAGYFRRIDDIDSGWARDQYRKLFAQVFVASQAVDGASVAVQLEADVAGLWFDRETLAAAGIAPPDTWAELAAACNLLAGKDAAPPLVLPGGPAAGEAATYCLLALLASNGARIIGPAGVLPDRDRLVQTLEYLQELVAQGAIAKESVDFARERPVQLLARGQAAFALAGSYELPALAGAAGLDQESAWRRFGFIPMPAGPSDSRANLAGGMALGIFRQGKRPDLALHVIRALLSADAQARMARSTGQIPTRTSVVPLVSDDESLLGKSAAMLDGAVVRPAVPSYDRVSQQLQKLLADIILDRISPAAASEYTAELISAITGLPVAAK
ncbi:extracellular solute-binding protein [Pseudarthrobacter sp. NPDC058362]|uniref:extracellular solute-binding protein n=1 Tax=Pseudarthrobacter sp. NPDC058362 TaxID=3346458 RepID=UPI003661A6D0